jgi:hypothetical protein
LLHNGAKDDSLVVFLINKRFDADGDLSVSIGIESRDSPSCSTVSRHAWIWFDPSAF